MVWPLRTRATTHPQNRDAHRLYRRTQIQARLAAFRQGLESNGWKEGRNINIDYRFTPAA
jgi:hypothetical protein